MPYVNQREIVLEVDVQEWLPTELLDIKQEGS